MSLGYRPRCDHNALRQGEVAPRTTTTLSISAPTCTTHEIGLSSSAMGAIPKGFIPLFIYSALFLLPPVLYEYVTYDYTNTVTRGGVIGIAGGYALAVVLANDCVAWFNMLLFFHIGLEVKVAEILADYANASGTTNTDMILAWIGFGVVIAHLVPFLLVDNTMFLSLLAFAGVIVNAAVLVYLDSDRLLLVGLSSGALLISTLCISGVCDVATSHLTALRKAMTKGTWIVFTKYC